MHVGRKAQKREKKAMSVSLYGNLFFVIVEIVMAIYTSSQAVLLDAIYDGVEFCMLLPSLTSHPMKSTRSVICRLNLCLSLSRALP